MSSNNFAAFSWMATPPNIAQIQAFIPSPQPSIQKSLPVADLAISLHAAPSLPIKMIRNYQEKTKNIADPTPMFEEAIRHIREIRDSANHHELLVESLRKGLPDVVFSSNYIDRTGMSLRHTTEMVQGILAGEEIKAEDIDTSSDDYQNATDYMASAYGFEPTMIDRDLIIQSRREVIQHTKAFLHITTKVVINKQRLSAQLIKDTHRILVTGIDRHEYSDEGTRTNSTPWQSHGGVYRSVTVMGGPASFVVPRQIPRTMDELISKFHADMNQALRSGAIDPFHLAAKYSNLLVLIHPFLDANGRLCRLILNALILKYTGTVCAFGGSDEARKEYCRIVMRASEVVSDDQSELAAFVLGKVVGRLRGLARSVIRTE